jgi:hypothetical protein
LPLALALDILYGSQILLPHPGCDLGLAGLGVLALGEDDGVQAEL